LVLCRHLFQPLLLGDLRLRVSQHDFEVAQGRDLRSRLGPPAETYTARPLAGGFSNGILCTEYSLYLGPEKASGGPDRERGQKTKIK
jgi:hypothetical protein